MPFLFLLVLVLLLLLCNVLSFVSCVYRSERYQYNRRDQRLRRSNLRRGNNRYVFCPFLFVFSSFLLLALLPDYLLYREVGSDWRHGKQKRFDRGHGGRRQITRALLVRSGGNGHMFQYSLFSSLLFSLFLFSDYLLFSKISNRRAGAGPNRTDAGGKRNANKTGRGKGYVSSCLFSLLNSCLLLALLLFQSSTV